MLLGLIFSCMAQPGTSESSCECDADTDSDADTDTDTDSDADTDTDVAPLTVGVPAYFYPGDLWAQASLPGGGILVMNPASGPGTEVNADYVAAVGAARAAGMKVLGYVHTSYGARQASLVEADIDAYAAWYSIDGVFFDEVPGLADCAGQRALYEGYATRVRGLDSSATVALNPGTETCEDYLDFADSLVVWENHASEWGSWTPPSWLADHDRGAFWVLVHGVGSAEAMQGILQSAREINVGTVYVTDDVLPNPWDTLPSYWEQEISAL